MLRHLVAVFAPEESGALDAGVKQLGQQVGRLSARGETVAATATGMIQVMDRIVPKIGKAPMDDGAIKKLADLILNDVAYLKEADLQSTLQAALALNALLNSLARSVPALTKADLTKSIDSLYRYIDPPERFDPDRFTNQLQALKRYVQ